MRILFIGDVVGAPGRRAIEQRLPALRADLGADFCVLNGENAADGVGITPKLAARLLGVGADVITLGNHTWRRGEIASYLARSDRVIRPANFQAGAPGSGLVVAAGSDGTDVAVINVMGSLFLEVAVNMFEVIDQLVEEARARTPVVLVDVHAEATSEKVALARWLDGKVTAVLGTHTHVQTADARIQPGGTAAMTDAGMTGPHDSVIGVEAELAIRRMRTGMPVRFETAQGGVRIEGCVVDCDPATGRATAIAPVRIDYP
jgi:metallophosphoesterase (TIGR00282 family)